MQRRRNSKRNIIEKQAGKEYDEQKQQMVY